ncbi:MAG: NUDIX domain-containing protein [Pseudomonadales bacterium]|nr:NUDIX domain-containing protein [Pseudomonadales bacterium]
MKDNLEQNNFQGVEAPKVCYTAGGMLIDDDKVLLVKHKKLGIWLNPGGHINEGELPHQAAQREFYEETGVEVRAIDFFKVSKMFRDFSVFDSTGESKFVPNPISTNLHWVNKESYDLRLKSKFPNQRFPTKIWKRGCEQHVGFFYLLEPIDRVEFSQNEKETDGIAWFSLSQIETLETKESIKQEIKLGFKIHGFN